MLIKDSKNSLDVRYAFIVQVNATNATTYLTIVARH